jgi:hypothetical protein
MPFLTKGKTNWKYILIVVILVVIVGGGILGYLRYFKREISFLSKFPEIKKPEKKGVSITTDKTEYKEGENVNIILDTGGKEIYLKKNVFTGKILISKEYEVYKLQGTDWVKLRIDTYCGNVMVCGESGPLLPACPAPPQPECNKITNRITWVWDQKTWEYVEKTCVNIPYTDEELKQVEPGTYKIRVTYYDSNSCTGTPKYLETQFKITDETANWKTYRNEEYGFEIKYPEKINAKFIKFISLEKRPPDIVISPGISQLVCEEFVGKSTVEFPQGVNQKKITIDGETYCRLSAEEGAMGTISTFYSYSTIKNGKQITLKFSLIHPNCDMYIGDKMEKCIQEIHFFSDILAHEMLSTFRFLE